MPVQFIIKKENGKPYEKRTLPSKAKVLQGANEEQKQKLQKLHEDKSKTYDLDAARQEVGLPPLKQKTEPKAPFPWRWDRSTGAEPHMKVRETGGGGFVAESGKSTFEGEPMISMSTGLSASELQQGSKRKRSQIQTTGLSPTDAAKCAKLPKGGEKGRHEWLHLVAFSIGETHVGSLSSESKEWVKKSDQVQQIKENLVLGSKAANTAMISVETFIKETMKKHRHFELHLWVAAETEEAECKESGIKFRWSKQIRYDFLFLDAQEGDAIGPFVVTFNTLKLEPPPISEFEKTISALKEQTPKRIPVGSLRGPSTKGMELVSSGYGKARKVKGKARYKPY